MRKVYKTCQGSLKGKHLLLLHLVLGLGTFPFSGHSEETRSLIAPESFEVHILPNGQERMKKDFNDFLGLYDFDISKLTLSPRTVPIETGSQDKVQNRLLNEFHKIFSTLFLGFDKKKLPAFFIELGDFGYKSVLESSAISIDPTPLSHYGLSDGVLLQMTATARNFVFGVQSGALIDSTGVFPFAPLSIEKISLRRTNGPSPLSVTFVVHAHFTPGAGLILSPIAAKSNVLFQNLKLNFSKLRIPPITVSVGNQQYKLNHEAAQNYALSQLPSWALELKPWIDNLVKTEGPSWINAALEPLSRALRSSFDLPLGSTQDQSFVLPLDLFPQKVFKNSVGSLVVQYASAMKGHAKQSTIAAATIGALKTKKTNKFTRFSQRAIDTSDIMIRILPDLTKLISQALFDQGAYTKFGVEEGMPITLSEPAILDYPTNQQGFLQQYGEEAEIRAVLDLKALGRSPYPKKGERGYRRRYAWTRFKNKLNEHIENGVFKRDLRITFWIGILPTLNTKKNQYDIQVTGINRFGVDDDSLRTAHLRRFIINKVEDAVKEYNRELSKTKSPFTSIPIPDNIVSIPVTPTHLKFESQGISAYFKLKAFKKP